LAALSDDARWAAFEGALNRQLRRVDDLQPACVRRDSTAASGQWTVTEDGLFQFGHSKDHRPDLPQVKVMLAALDPLGLPVATDVVPGPRADDPLYGPAIVRVQGLLAVHDTDPVQERLLRRDGSRPPTVRVEREVQVTAVVDRHAVAGAIRPLGWRV
jgi:hypothetical protein